jgi:hypothetical protein
VVGVDYVVVPTDVDDDDDVRCDRYHTTNTSTGNDSTIFKIIVRQRLCSPQDGSNIQSGRVQKDWKVSGVGSLTFAPKASGSARNLDFSDVEEIPYCRVPLGHPLVVPHDKWGSLFTRAWN